MKFKVISVTNPNKNDDEDFRNSEGQVQYKSMKDMFCNFAIKLDNEQLHEFLSDRPFHSMEEFKSQSYSDFSHKILFRQFYPMLGDIFKKTCLEIGFGSGRLMNPACKFFKHIYGIDIHNNFAAVKKYLGKNGNKNYTLLHRSQAEINLKENTLDFFYSFDTCDHFDEFHEIEYYMKMLKRWLKPYALGIIYFKRSDIIFPKESSGDTIFWRRYFPGTGRSILLVHPDFMVQKLKEWGYTILERGMMPISLASSTCEDGAGIFYMSVQNKLSDI